MTMKKSKVKPINKISKRKYNTTEFKSHPDNYTMFLNQIWWCFLIARATN